MKIRNGFVSNSSSSSFIIDCKGGEPCDCCGRTGVNVERLRSLCDLDYSDESRIYAEGNDEVLEYCTENYGIDSKEILDKIKNAEDPIILSAAYGNELLLDLITENNDVEVIYHA